MRCSTAAVLTLCWRRAKLLSNQACPVRSSTTAGCLRRRPRRSNDTVQTAARQAARARRCKAQARAWRRKVRQARWRRMAEEARRMACDMTLRTGVAGVWEEEAGREPPPTPPLRRFKAPKRNIPVQIKHTHNKHSKQDQKRVKTPRKTKQNLEYI